MWDYAAFIEGFAQSAISPFSHLLPWQITTGSEDHVSLLLGALGPEYRKIGNVAVHESARVEDGAVLKGPLIIGPGCFVAAGAYLRGGCWLEADNIIGPSCELKSSFLFRGTKLAHFNFVGDSILGAACNIEAGAIVANYRNEQADPKIAFWRNGQLLETYAMKFGVLAGDGLKIGANAVVAPGAIFDPATIIPRLALVDQSDPAPR